MEGLAALVDLGQITLSGIGGISLLLLILGRIIPKSTVDTLLAGRDAEIVRANERATEYRSLAETERTGREVAMEQNREWMEVARTVEHVMESLQLVVEGRTSGPPA